MRSGSTASSVQTITQQRGEAAQLGRIKEGEAGRWRGWGGGGCSFECKVCTHPPNRRPPRPHPPPPPTHAMTAAPAASPHDPEESLTFHGRHRGASTGAHQNFIPQLCWPTLDVVRGDGGFGGRGGGGPQSPPPPRRAYRLRRGQPAEGGQNLLPAAYRPGCPSS